MLLFFLMLLFNKLAFLVERETSPSNNNNNTNAYKNIYSFIYNALMIDFKMNRSLMIWISNCGRQQQPPPPTALCSIYMNIIYIGIHTEKSLQLKLFLVLLCNIHFWNFSNTYFETKQEPQILCLFVIYFSSNFWLKNRIVIFHQGPTNTALTTI